VKFSKLIKKINTNSYTELIIPIVDIKAQYNPSRFKLWKSLHSGPDKEVLNMLYSPHCRFLKQYKKFGMDIATVNSTSYYKLQKLYGRNDKWIKEKIYKFLDVFNSISSDGYNEEIIVLSSPLVKNKYNNSFEVFEGHHRLSCCYTLGYTEMKCKIIRRV